MMVQRQRWTDLGDAAFLQYCLAGIQQHDLVRQSHGFHLIVSDVDHAGPQLTMQLGNLDPSLHPQRRVQIG